MKANDGSLPLVPAGFGGKRYIWPLEIYEVIWVEHVSGKVFRNLQRYLENLGKEVEKQRKGIEEGSCWTDEVVLLGRRSKSC